MNQKFVFGLGLGCMTIAGIISSPAKAGFVLEIPSSPELECNVSLRKVAPTRTGVLEIHQMVQDYARDANGQLIYLKDSKGQEYGDPVGKVDAKGKPVMVEKTVDQIRVVPAADGLGYFIYRSHNYGKSDRTPGDEPVQFVLSQSGGPNEKLKVQLGDGHVVYLTKTAGAVQLSSQVLGNSSEYDSHTAKAQLGNESLAAESVAGELSRQVQGLQINDKNADDAASLLQACQNRKLQNVQARNQVAIKLDEAWHASDRLLLEKIAKNLKETGYHVGGVCPEAGPQLCAANPNQGYTGNAAGKQGDTTSTSGPEGKTVPQGSSSAQGGSPNPKF